MTDGEWAFLIDDMEGARKLLDALSMWELEYATAGHDERLRALWQANREAVLDYYQENFPGSRPAAWWMFDAAEKRQRVSGAGCPAFECKNLVPAFWYGVPTDWADFDASNPPAFESQPSYLRRHGLLTASEQRQLSAEDFTPETMTREDFRQWDSRPWREVAREQILARVAAGEETAERAAKLLGELRQ